MVQVLGDRLGVERGGHHGQFQIRSPGPLKPLHQRQRRVAQEVAFVKLVEQDDPDIGKRRIILQPAEENAFGDEADARSEGCLVVKADLVTDLLAEPAAAFPGDPRRHGARSHAPRLEHDNPG